MPATEYVMVVGVVLAFDRVTVSDPSVAGSVPLMVFAIETVEASSSPIVFVAVSAVPSVGDPAVTPVKVTITVSLPSTMKSSVTSTRMVPVSVFAGMVMEPERVV